MLKNDEVIDFLTSTESHFIWQLDVECRISLCRIYWRDKKAPVE